MCPSTEALFSIQALWCHACCGAHAGVLGMFARVGACLAACLPACLPADAPPDRWSDMLGVPPFTELPLSLVVLADPTFT